MLTQVMRLRESLSLTVPPRPHLSKGKEPPQCALMHTAQGRAHASPSGGPRLLQPILGHLHMCLPFAKPHILPSEAPPTQVFPSPAFCRAWSQATHGAGATVKTQIPGPAPDPWNQDPGSRPWSLHCRTTQTGVREPPP